QDQRTVLEIGAQTLGYRVRAGQRQAEGAGVGAEFQEAVEDLADHLVGLPVGGGVDVAVHEFRVLLALGGGQRFGGRLAERAVGATLGGPVFGDQVVVDHGQQLRGEVGEGGQVGAG